MKKKTIIPMAFAAVMMFGCAGSDDTMNNTTAMDDTTTTMSETQSMAGTAADADAGTMNALVIEREIVAPIATISMTALPMENPVQVGDMFEDIDDTEQYSIMDLARRSPNLTTFVSLVEQADMVQDIERLDQATIFAPTNEAFANMDRQQLEMLLMPDNRAILMQVLQAHVLPSKVSTAQFNNTQRIRFTEDRYIPIDVDMNGTNVTVGGANLVKTNVEASDGYIHVVDRVILPDQVAVEGTRGVGGY